MPELVHSLKDATDVYWASNTRREMQAAYHEILLFGGKDGYRLGWRNTVARWLRILALKIESQ